MDRRSGAQPVKACMPIRPYQVYFEYILLIYTFVQTSGHENIILKT